jgi:hypothetical protein
MMRLLLILGMLAATACGDLSFDYSQPTQDSQLGIDVPPRLGDRAFLTSFITGNIFYAPTGSLQSAAFVANFVSNQASPLQDYRNIGYLGGPCDIYRHPVSGTSNGDCYAEITQTQASPTPYSNSSRHALVHWTCLDLIAQDATGNPTPDYVLDGAVARIRHIPATQINTAWYMNPANQWSTQNQASIQTWVQNALGVFYPGETFDQNDGASVKSRFASLGRTAHDLYFSAAANPDVRAAWRYVTYTLCNSSHWQIL